MGGTTMINSENEMKWYMWVRKDGLTSKTVKKGKALVISRVMSKCAILSDKYPFTSEQRQDYLSKLVSGENGF